MGRGRGGRLRGLGRRGVEVRDRRPSPLADSIVAALVAEGPTADELTRAKAGAEYQLVSGLESPLGKAEILLDEVLAALDGGHAPARGLGVGRRGRARPARKFPLVVFAAVASILTIQTFVLFPLLDERSIKVIAGETAPYSGLHIVYIIADSIKVVLLFALGSSLAKNALKASE